MKITILLFLILSSVAALAAGDSCEQALSTSPWFQRRAAEPEVDYFHPLKYINEKTRADVWGKVDSKFREDLDTRIWFGTLGSPAPTGELPLVDPNAKGVFIFFHGSGTMQSSGKNFYGNINSLASVGYTGVSFDMPFHGEGPTSDSFYNVDYFMNWIDKIVKEVKKSGKPVYLVGHSFGPDVIAEYLLRHPFEVKGALMISPAGFDEVLADWYQNYTVKMKFGGDAPKNTLAMQWAGRVSRQFRWKNKGADISLLNPDLKINLLMGDREEFVPAPVGGSNKTPTGKNTYDAIAAYKKLVRRVDAVLEEGVGHFIFTHQDREGHNVVFREILRLAGEDIRQTTAMGTMPAADKLSFKYASDRNFRSWADHKVGRRAVLGIAQTRQNEFEANLILNQYETDKKVYEATLLQKILEGGVQIPGFYESNKSLFALVKKDAKANGPALLTSFAKYLNSLSESEQQRVLLALQMLPG